MWAALLGVGLLALPGLSLGLVAAGLRWLTGAGPPRVFRPFVAFAERHPVRLPWRHRSRPQPLPDILLVLELRRMAAEVRRVEDGVQPHRAARLRAVMAAYDHVLLELAAVSHVPAPVGQVPLSQRARLEVETALVSSGVDW
jgi:hypothetical protein